MEYQTKRQARLDGDRPVDRLTTPFPGAGACHAATASSVIQTVRLPRLTGAASYPGQLVTRYLALGILWRRVWLNLYGIDLTGRDGDRTVISSTLPCPTATYGTAFVVLRPSVYSRANA